jgi:hypothetical protein
MRTRKTVVILISGKAGSGKTTIANILRKKLTEITPISVYHGSFAYPIKKLCEVYIDWDGEKDERGRKLLQNIGRDGREYDQDIWVKKMMQNADQKAGLLPFDFILVDDWRFPNELAYLQKDKLLDVVSVRVYGRQSEMSKNLALDVSENSLPEAGNGLYDIEINNDGAVEDLEITLDLLLAKIQTKFILE